MELIFKQTRRCSLILWGGGGEGVWMRKATVTESHLHFPEHQNVKYRYSYYMYISGYSKINESLNSLRSQLIWVLTISLHEMYAITFYALQNIGQENLSTNLKRWVL